MAERAAEPKRRRKRWRGVSYAWARHLEASPVDPETLSEAAAYGLELAQQLADDAFERSRDPRRHLQLQPLTVEQLADEEGLEPAEVRRLIARARRRLFGTLTDAAISKRSQRQQGRTPRQCEESGCGIRIPVSAPANKRFCPQHATPAARVRRHRRAGGDDKGAVKQSASARPGCGARSGVAHRRAQLVREGGR